MLRLQTSGKLHGVVHDHDEDDDDEDDEDDDETDEDDEIDETDENADTGEYDEYDEIDKDDETDEYDEIDETDEDDDDDETDENDETDSHAMLLMLMLVMMMMMWASVTPTQSILGMANLMIVDGPTLRVRLWAHFGGLSCENKPKDISRRVQDQHKSQWAKTAFFRVLRIRE